MCGKRVFLKVFLVMLLINFIFLGNMVVYSDDCEEENYNGLMFDENNIEVCNSPTKEPSINSRAAIIIDRKTGIVLYEKNSNEIRKMASTTKIMTALVVIENTSNVYKTVTISKKAASIGGSVLGIKTNDKITINDLLYGLMLKSGNDTALALAEAVGGSVEEFAELMNKKAKELGLSNTHFVTPHGLDNENHYTTAFELAKLTNYALNNKYFKELVRTKNYNIKINNNTLNVSNSNELLGNFIGVYGVKTGFTSLANRCLVTACEREGLDVISVVLGADTKTHRTKDSRNMLNYIYENFKNIDLKQEVESYFKIWNADNFIEVEKGIEKYLELKLGDIRFEQIPINKNNINKIQININCIKSVESPIYENTKVGEVLINLEGKELLKVDILTDKSAQSKTVLNYLEEMLISFKRWWTRGHTNCPLKKVDSLCVPVSTCYFALSIFH